MISVRASVSVARGTEGCAVIAVPLDTTVTPTAEVSEIGTMSLLIINPRSDQW